MAKVFVLMSGGVDSSVAAALLKQQGYDVTGCHLKCWSETDGVGGCTAAQDAEDARRVAEVLDIPFYVFDFEREYRDDVVRESVEGYKNGITPNPDVWCNTRIKFGAFFRKASALGAEFVASGHYARADRNHGIFAARDTAKDQTYFLWQIPRDIFAKIIFPIGEHRKGEVRQLAREFKLPTAEKKDSQGLCFVGKLDFQEFLKRYISETAGPIYDTAGQRIGTHAGAQYYTVGQRHGLNIGNGKGPYYVSAKDVATNTVFVTRGDGQNLYATDVPLRGLNWLITPPEAPVQVRARTRYRQPLAGAIFYPNENLLVFEKPQKAVTAGQSAVIYRGADDGPQMLGGGIIA